MKERIMRLCKRLKKFSLDDIILISELEEGDILAILNELEQEKVIDNNDGYYVYLKSASEKRLNKPICFQYHSKQEIEYMLKGFCADVETRKMINLFGLGHNVLDKFYGIFRASIYDKQKMELLKHFQKKPKIAQERIYMNKKVFLYLYNHKLYVSEKYLVSKDAIKHKEHERLEIKKIYLRSYRKVLSTCYEINFHLHLAEELWKYGKSFDEKQKLLTKMI